ncbi:alpha-glucan phosphorylase [Clostridium sp. CAG:470]|mgnify:FL=1|nr:MAG: alpha-glucan phosphorylase [Clostridium sp. 28_17]CDE15111.1 alpha-glucan phosphorylase [Clostridium sp. CAG:470]
MYVFNKITVNPQLPKRIGKLSEIANNLWWSWNTEFLRLFKIIDRDLWETCEKNPVKFLKRVSQDRLEAVVENTDFLREYDRLAKEFDDYITSKNTWFSNKYPENKKDLIAYFSAEYGLDQTIPIYSGGLGILSGDHLKSASDLGIPLVAVGLLYKNGYFHQKINENGEQETEYNNIELSNLPINPVKDENGEELKIYVKFEKRKVYLKVWQINVGRIKLYLLDSDIDENTPKDREVTLHLYGGDQEMRIKQEIILGMGGTNLLTRALGLNPTVYHMNEGHSAFLILELIKNIIKEKKVSFEVAKDIASSKTVFTTHTPVPAGNDIFPIGLVEKYFKEFWPRLGLDREEFLKLGMKPCTELEPGFNMGIFALKVAGKKNGVSKLHGAVSRELFGDVWPEIAANESPITYVTNGIHTCSWLAPSLKELYNKYLIPYWQDNIYKDEVWENINNIPNQELWGIHQKRKQKLFDIVKENTTNRLRKSGYSYEEINEITSKLNPNALTIGFARRFATYKRATLIFKDLERITQILNNADRPVQLIFAGKAHPADKEGQDLIKRIHEISMMPQFKGKIFLLENYNIAMSRYLVSGVDVWLNNPRRPMEASGTSGQKASVNGVINFSVLDGWWAEGYNQENGWTIGTNAEFTSYEEQDIADSQSMYRTLEEKIIPTYYEKDENGISEKWMKIMKNSITSTGGKYSTSRMLVDYTNNLYIPLCNLTKKYYENIDNVAEFNLWKKNLYTNWKDIKITQKNNLNNITMDAGNNIDVKCEVQLPNVDVSNVMAQCYYGKILDNGIVENVSIIPMKLSSKNEENKTYEYTAKIELKTGGNYGYTFRVMPKHEMLLDSENLNLVKWITD